MNRTAIVACGALFFGSGIVLPAAESMTIVDLGPGSAYDINSAGHVAAIVGGRTVMYNGLTNRVVGPWAFDGVAAINDADEMVVTFDGFYYILNGADFTGFPEFMGGLTVTDLNDSGLVTGSVFPGLGDDPYVKSFVDTAPHNLFDYYFSDFDSRLQHVNNSGVAVGSASTNYHAYVDGNNVPRKAFYPNRACKILDGNLEFIDSRQPPSTWPSTEADFLSSAQSISEGGRITGWMRQQGGGARHAFYYWESSMMTDIGTLGGSESIGLGINSNGDVVGWANTVAGESHAFIYSAGSMTDLNESLQAGTGWVLTVARAINDNGQIVGEGTLGGVTRAFFLTPAGLGQPPTITEQPKGAVLGLGANYTLSVNAAGTTPFSYRWYKDGVELVGENSSTLTLTDVNGNTAGSYRVYVSNSVAEQGSDLAVIQVSDPVVDIAVFAGISIYGEIGGIYEVDYKESVNDINWIPMQSGIVLTNSPQLVIDPTPAQTKRIYRAVRTE